MLNQNNNYRLYDSNAVFEAAILSVIGDREEQQDSSGLEMKNDEGIVVVCDGMGGHDGGKTASSLAVELFLNSYLEEYPCEDLNSLLIDAAEFADRKVAELRSENNAPLMAGSTVTAVCIRGAELHWLSVGDSRIYIHRGGELARVTSDHNYKTLLTMQLENGDIGREDYENGMRQGEALISFLGINGLPYIESNNKPFTLMSGDKVILATDGLYKTVPEEEIGRIIDNFESVEDALSAIEMKAKKYGRNLSRDNMTVAIIKKL